MSNGSEMFAQFPAAWQITPKVVDYCREPELVVEGSLFNGEIHLSVRFPTMPREEQAPYVNKFFPDAVRCEEVPEELGEGYTVLQGWYVVYHDALGATHTLLQRRVAALLDAVKEA